MDGIRWNFRKLEFKFFAFTGAQPLDRLENESFVIEQRIREQRGKIQLDESGNRRLAFGLHKGLHRSVYHHGEE